MRILTVDIETAPHLGYVWSLWQQNVSLAQLAEVGSVLCFAAKWYGETKVIYSSDFHHGHDEMVRRSWELYDEADAVVTFNGRSFDNKHLAREWLLAGLGPPAQPKDIDLLLVARKRFKFASNKLEHLASELGIGHKLKHAGFELWVRCLADDPVAWAQMRRYNMQDVRLTEQLYDRLLPWIHNHPNRLLYDGTGTCGKCGSTRELMRRGWTRTTTGKYRQFQCKDCGSYSTATHRESSVDVVPV